jgi:carboxyl-terminal processing protease
MRFGVGAVLIAVVALTAAGTGFVVGRDNPGLLGPFRSANADTSLDLTAFWEAWNYLRQEYYQQPLDRQTLVRGATRGLLAATGDDNTGYLPPQDFQLFSSQLQGSFEGIGAEVDSRDGQLVVVAPLPNSPAERAGVRAGDQIVKIDGNDASKYALLEAISKVRGPTATTVTLTLRRPADPSTLDAASRQRLLDTLPQLQDALRANDAAKAKAAATPVGDALKALAGATVDADVAIVRDVIAQPKVDTQMLANGVGYIKLAQFSRNVSSEFDGSLAAILSAGATSLVLDLRGNSGGFVNEAVAIASQFLRENTVVFTEQRADGKRDYTATAGGRALAQPLVVLVDRGTASAAEILSAALHDNGRAKLVGEKTYGKGTEQLQQVLADGGGARITVARWLTPSGIWVHHQGIEPDVTVTDSDRAPPDLVLQRAIDLLSAPH